MDGFSLPLFAAKEQIHDLLHTKPFFNKDAVKSAEQGHEPVGKF